MDNVQNDMVFIVDKGKRPFGFVSEKRACQLLSQGKAVVHSYNPFVIRHKTKDARECTRLDFKVKVDPGSMYTGLAIVDLNNNAYWKCVIEHRGQAIVSALKSRYDNRHNRRNRNTPYRRNKNKHKSDQQTSRPEGWLPPSVVSIEQNIINIVRKLMQYVNIVECSVENVKFDFQKLENPDIWGVEYQHDTLEGKTLREYLFEQCGGTCQYCGGATGDKKLEVEHITSRRNRGTNRLHNLTLACHTCNQLKGARNLDVFLEDLKKSNSDIDKKRVAAISGVLEGRVHKPKRYGAWVNSMKDRLASDLMSIFRRDRVELSDGATTRMNRIKHGLPKEHYNDAICVGKVPDTFKDHTTVVHAFIAKGRGKRLKGKPNCCGILKKDNIHREKSFKGFQTGDLCKIKITKGKYTGEYVARIAIRHNGYFDFRRNGGRITTSYKNCTILQHGNGYDYSHYLARTKE